VEGKKGNLASMGSVISFQFTLHSKNFPPSIPPSSRYKRPAGIPPFHKGVIKKLDRGHRPSTNTQTTSSSGRRVETPRIFPPRSINQSINQSIKARPQEQSCPQAQSCSRRSHSQHQTPHLHHLHPHHFHYHFRRRRQNHHRRC
jgi:hypothetical protein